MGSGTDAVDSAELFLLPWSSLLGVDRANLALLETRELMGGKLVSARFGHGPSQRLRW